MQVAGGSRTARRVVAALTAVLTLLAVTSIAVRAAPTPPVLSLDSAGTDASGYVVNLSWTYPDEASSTPVITSQVLRRKLGGPQAQFAPADGDRTFSDRPPHQQNYQYWLEAVVDGVPVTSNTVDVTNVNDTNPAAPTNVTVSPTDRGCLRIDWDLSVSPDVTGYEVFDGTATASVSGALLPTADWYEDCGVADGATRQYVVRTYDDDGLHTDTVAVSGSTLPVPPAPTGVAASADQSTVTVTWDAVTDPEGDPVSYVVSRGTTSGGPYTEVASGVAETELLDTGLAVGTYYYVVRAVADRPEGDGYASADSAEDSATVLAAPAAPSAIADGSTVEVTWTAIGGAARYDVRRATSSSGPFTTVADDVTGTTFTDTGLSGGTVYYQVRGETAGGDIGPWSASGTTTVIAAPNNVRIELKDGRPKIEWSGVGGASSYEVGRATSASGPFVPVGTTSSTTFTDTSTASGTTYHYVVVAVVGGIRSIPSSPVSITTPSSGGTGGSDPTPEPTKTPPGQVKKTPEPTTEPTTSEPTGPLPEPTVDPSPFVPPGQGGTPPGQGGSQPGQGGSGGQPAPGTEPPPAGGTGGTGGGTTGGAGGGTTGGNAPAPRPAPNPPPGPVAPVDDGGPSGPPPGQVTLPPTEGDAPRRTPAREAPGSVEVRDLQFAPNRREQDPSTEPPLAVVEAPVPVEIPADGGGPSVGRALLPPNTLADLALAQGNIGAALSASAEEVAENVGTVVRVFRVPLFLLVMMMVYLIVRERLGREVITAAADVPEGGDDDDIEYLL